MLRAVGNTTLKSITKGGGGRGGKNLSKKRYVIVEQPLMIYKWRRGGMSPLANKCNQTIAILVYQY